MDLLDYLVMKYIRMYPTPIVSVLFVRVIPTYCSIILFFSFLCMYLLV